MQVESAGRALRRRLVFLVVFTIAVLAFAQAAHAHGNDDHRGNQGSVKVDDDDIDDGPANHPHVVCGLLIVVEHGVGSPFDIDFVALAPTTKPAGDQRVLIVHVPAGDNVSGLIDLRAVLGGIVPNPQQGFHIAVTVHLPGGDKHKVIWVGLCPSEQQASTTTTTAKAGTTTTTAKSGTTTTTTATSGSTTTSVTAVGGAVTNNIPTQVLGENFTKPADSAGAATSLATTGSPFPPVLAFGLVLGGLVLVGGARRVSGRRLETTMRRSSDRDS